MSRFSYIPETVNSPVNQLNYSEQIKYWYPWVADLKNKNGYLYLHQQWGTNGEYPPPPPPGYDYYIVSGDSLMFGLAEHVATHVAGKVIQLTSAYIPDSYDTDRIKYIEYNTAHLRINRMPKDWPIIKNIQYTASALTNRRSESKIIIFSALMELLKDKVVASLHNNHYHLKNIHNWDISGSELCDHYIKLFREKWNNKEILLPADDNIEGSYNNTAYQEAALNFTQKSYHYSFLYKNNQEYEIPGPFVTEKTWKCLLSKTAFIPVGQRHIYKWLQKLGLQFNYGPLDLSFDNELGDLIRLEKIIKLIESLNQWTPQEIFEMTKESSEHNYNHVQSKEFWDVCERNNQPLYEYLNANC